MALRGFVPASFPEPHQPVGLSGFMAASFPLPMVPLRNPSRPAVAIKAVKQSDGSFLPIITTAAGGLGCLGCAGLGQTSSFDLSSVGTSISSAWDSLNSQTVAGMPMGYVLIGGAALLIVVMGMGGKTRTLRKAAQYKAKEAYQAQLARIKDQYPGLTAKARQAIARSTS